jgi:hypothetical protein
MRPSTFNSRKLNRGSISEDPIVIHPEILNALDLYLQSKVEDVTCHVAKFLNMFLTESPFLEAFEIDNFILRNGKIIASWYVADSSWSIFVLKFLQVSGLPMIYNEMMWQLLAQPFY